MMLLDSRKGTCEKCGRTRTLIEFTVEIQEGARIGTSGGPNASGIWSGRSANTSTFTGRGTRR